MKISKLWCAKNGKWSWFVRRDDGKLISCTTDCEGKGIYEMVVDHENANGATFNRPAEDEFTLYGYSVGGARRKLKRFYGIK